MTGDTAFGLGGPLGGSGGLRFDLRKRHRLPPLSADPLIDIGCVSRVYQ